MLPPPAIIRTISICGVPWAAQRLWGEFNPWQTTMGQGAQAALEAVGVIVHRVDDAALAAETVQAAARFAFSSYRAVAVLIGQRVIGFKEFAK